ncbi:MAG: multiheme c-type cytochrome [Rhodomicrobiaceae bacterium]
MKRLSTTAMLSSVFASAALLHAAFLSPNAAAEASEALQSQTEQRQPGLRVAGGSLTGNKGDRLPMPSDGRPTAYEQNGAVNSTSAVKSGEQTIEKQEAQTQRPEAAQPAEPIEAVSQEAETQPSNVAEPVESADAASQTEAADTFGGDLLAQDRASDQSDDLLYPSEDELRGMNAPIESVGRPAKPAATPGNAAPATAAQPQRAIANPAATAAPNAADGGEKVSVEVEAGGNAALSALIPTSDVKDDTLPKISQAELSLYPTAAQCGECHKQIYDEWRSSQHAYASISPMFHKFEQKFTELTQGTVGTFCVRCHQQVGTQLGENRETPLWERAQISREGVTCITCHRVPEQYGKVNGERRVIPGSIFDPVYGSGESSVIKEIIANKETYSVKTSEDGRGNEIHNGMMTNPQITKSEFCVSCHQVAVNLGIKLEIVWDQYRASPARKQGITCQDCHMGKVPGKPEGYATAPSAIVGGKEINPGRRHADHRFIGPGYSIAHPGIFPHNVKAQTWSIKKWLQFDWRAGWGTPQFEDEVASGRLNVNFPQAWADPVDREEAWQVIAENFGALRERRELRRQVMENSTDVDGPYIESSPRVGRDLAFSYKIKNKNSGHNLPSGSLGAQPQLWVNVALMDPDGKNVWESGYVDSNGDMADLHSLDVAAGTIATDQQLVHFQTKFLTTNVKGTDREMYLPVNFDIDPLPHLRPPQVPTSVLNHPPLVRMENHSLPPLGEKVASYRVPGNLITKPGKYRLAFRLRSRAEPIYFMRFVGATKEMERRMNEWMMDFGAYAVEVEVK